MSYLKLDAVAEKLIQEKRYDAAHDIRPEAWRLKAYLIGRLAQARENGCRDQMDYILTVIAVLEKEIK